MTKAKPQTAAAKPQPESAFMAWLKKAPHGLDLDRAEESSVLTITLSHDNWLRLAQVASAHEHTLDEAASDLLNDGLWACMENNQLYGAEVIEKKEQETAARLRLS